ncbi:MAG: hypothetical protein WC586_10555 [Methanoregula sp.]
MIPPGSEPVLDTVRLWIFHKKKFCRFRPAAQAGPAGLDASAGTATSVSISIRSARFRTIFIAAFSSGASDLTPV